MMLVVVWEEGKGEERGSYPWTYKLVKCFVGHFAVDLRVFSTLPCPSRMHCM